MKNKKRRKVRPPTWKRVKQLEADLDAVKMRWGRDAGLLEGARLALVSAQEKERRLKGIIRQLRGEILEVWRECEPWVEENSKRPPPHSRKARK